ncbi:Macro domain [Fragilaria crotonensis]|nr:Macro domain [Fragilaria crotonensis]
MNISKVQTALMAVLKKDHPRFDVSRLPDSLKAQRDILDDLLIASNTKWSDDQLALFDQVHSRRRPVIPWTSIPNRLLFHGTTHVAIWKGDITSLQIDAIVNAANDAGLGCFTPQHRCIDNVIHRAAGPRLREECRTAMEQRGYPLHAGTPPIVTPGFNLPSDYVVHVTGPQVDKGARLTATDRELLASAYQGCLQQCADKGIRKIAFCCISTGLFGFPQEEASNIAVTSVLEWLEAHPDQVDLIVFNVFSDNDEDLYQKRLAYLGTPQQQNGDDGVNSCPSSSPSTRDRTLRLAKTWIEQADAILICAGSGMSVKEGEMVYVNQTDFAKHYPWFVKWGYRTSYEVMGLGQDRCVPMTAKWAMWAKHMHLQRWQFEPNEGYKTLLDMVNEKDYFVLTSNVD